MQSIENKYARLLVDYCLDLQAGEKLLIASTILGEPLIREVYREALKKGAHVEHQLSFSEQRKIFYENASGDQLEYSHVLHETAMREFDAFLAIKAPFNLLEDHDLDQNKLQKRNKALEEINQLYFRRTAEGSLKRSLCLYPTQASAQQARMSLEEYSRFVYNACKLQADDPAAEWVRVREQQQHIVDYLNGVKRVAYKGPQIDVSFSVEGRTWINSDGRTNMPSGEVFTGPVEDSVNGSVTFSYPSIYMGEEVKGVSLEIRDGKVVKWDADQGKELLDKIFEISGARRFGEVAIGTNGNIQQATGNILFDEKIGGTIHMAVGQSYMQTGGRNKSSIHWDMITDMKEESEIVADGETIYRNGKFLI